MVTRKPMTKSLHTITAVARVAAHLRSASEISRKQSPAALTAEALGILGYAYSAAELERTADDTLRRCVAAVAAL